MIGAFARMLGNRERLLAVEETEDQGYATRAHAPGGLEARRESRDAPPEAFVQRVSDEGGDVYVIPFVEALREWVKRRRAAAHDAADATAASPTEGGADGSAMLPRSSENA